MDICFVVILLMEFFLLGFILGLMGIRDKQNGLMDKWIRKVHKKYQGTILNGLCLLVSTLLL